MIPFLVFKTKIVKLFLLRILRMDMHMNKNDFSKPISPQKALIAIVGVIGIIGVSVLILLMYSRSGNLRKDLVEDSFIGQNVIGCKLFHGRWVQVSGIPEFSKKYGCYYSKINDTAL